MFQVVHEAQFFNMLAELIGVLVGEKLAANKNAYQRKPQLLLLNY